MSNYRFSFTQADATLTDMHAVNQRITSALAEMEGNVESTLADWTGAAQEQYKVSKAVWNGAAEQMTIALEMARTTLLSISDNYGTTEQNAAKIWNDVRGG